MKTQVKNFKSTGIAKVPYPKALREAVEEAMQYWVKFCKLPDTEKALVPYSNNSAGVGYEKKNGIGKNADRKENFDITIPGEKWVADNAHLFKSGGTLEFVRSVGKLVTLMKPLIIDFATGVESEFDIDSFREEVLLSEDRFFVRFIHYFGERNIGDEIASSHTDQSGFTLHLFESSPGFECLSYSGEWIRVPITAGETIIIPSMQFQLRSKGEVKALCHKVVSTKKTANVGRYSAVCFVQLSNTPQYNKLKYGRLQEMNPGFNYQMSFDEFKKLFK